MSGDAPYGVRESEPAERTRGDGAGQDEGDDRPHQARRCLQPRPRQREQPHDEQRHQAEQDRTPWRRREQAGEQQHTRDGTNEPSGRRVQEGDQRQARALELAAEAAWCRTGGSGTTRVARSRGASPGSRWCGPTTGRRALTGSITGHDAPGVTCGGGVQDRKGRRREQLCQPGVLPGSRTSRSGGYDTVGSGRVRDEHAPYD